MFGPFFKMTVICCSKRFAGHSKWANIRHTKAAKDTQRAQLFLSLSRRIKLAVHEGGGPNVNHNLQLSQAISVAKKQSMPMSSIENAIKSAQADKNALKSHWLEIKGPGSCFMIVSVISDNMKRTKDSIATILKKNQASFADRACKHLFEYKGEIFAKAPAGVTNILDTAIEHAIEVGAEEVMASDTQDDILKFVCEWKEINVVSSNLEKLNYNIQSSDFNFIPMTRVQLPDSHLEIMSKLMDLLEEHPDVIAIYDNIA